MAKRREGPPVEKQEFLDRAKPLPVMIDDCRYVMNRKEFRTGSFGWTYTGIISVRLAEDVYIEVVANLNLVVAGSKPKATED